MRHNTTQVNNPYTYFKYFLLILPFLLLSCDGTDPVSPADTKIYTVTFDTNGGSEKERQKVVEGKKIIKTIDPTKGTQIFIGWFANVAGTGDAFNFDTGVTNDLTLYAIWGYGVSFDTNGGSTVDNQTIIEGGKAVKPANDPTKGNLTFVRWSITADGTGDAFNFDTGVTNDLTLYAIWGYGVSFDTNGGSTVDNQTIIEGGKIAKPANDPTKGNLTFVRWSITADGTGDAFDFDPTLTEDVTLYAIWADRTKSYTITFSTNGGSDEESQTIAGGGKVVKPINDPTKGTQIFIGWFANVAGTGDAFNFDTVVTNDLTLYAIWEYGVSFDTNGGSTVDNQTIIGGGKVAKPANDPTKGNLTFVRWSITADGTGDAFDFDTTLTEDITLYAIWADGTKSYTITFSTNGGSDEESQTIAGGGKVVKPANDPTKGNLTFVRWSITADGTGDAFNFDTGVTNDLTLYAIWGYGVSFDTNGGSDEESQTIAGGGKVVKPANDPTKGNLTFVRWSITADGTGDAFNFDTGVTNDLTLYAIWADGTKSYTITFNSNGGSDEESQTIAGGGKVVKPANDPTKGNLTFVRWSITADGTGDAFNFDTGVTNDLTLYAIWGYRITFETNGGDAVSEQKTKGGGKVTFVGANQADKAFVWWYTKDAFDDVNNRYDFDKVVTGDITLYAKWEEASKYTISDNKITHINNASGIVEIPYSVAGSIVTGVEGDGNKNIFVSSINVENTTVTEVILPNGITSIGVRTFQKCISLTSITIPNSVTSIGNEAFFTCKALTSVTIPDSVTSIGEGAFEDCSSLTSIIIPDSVTSIGALAFRGCTALTSIIIPDSVTSIGALAFRGCTALTSVTIPDSVTSIGESVFAFCSSLKSITIPDSVTSISDGAFQNCFSLMSITIPDSVKSIGIGAFVSCKALTSVTIGNSVTSIGALAFRGCTALTSVTIGNSVTSIGDESFRGCSSLTSITIPDSVTSIGEEAFSSCSSLTSVTIPDSVTSIGNSAFNRCSSLTSITIGNSVTSIGVGAFADCSALTSITIPDSVTSIGTGAFNFCTQLASVRVEAITPPTIKELVGVNTNIFRNTSSSLSITVPAASVAAYKTNTFWSPYADRITGY